MTDFIEVPVCVNFEQDKQIGTLRLRKDALPDQPNWVLSIGYKVLGRTEDMAVSSYELVHVSIVNDSDYVAYLKQQGPEES